MDMIRANLCVFTQKSVLCLGTNTSARLSPWYGSVNVLFLLPVNIQVNIIAKKIVCMLTLMRMSLSLWGHIL